jgi:hypothetical protein
VRLTNNNAIDAAASWSPDSSQITFLSQRDNIAEIYAMNANGSNQHNLTGSTTDDSANPVWSPDGLQIAFTNYSRVPHSNSDEIYLFTISSGNVSRVTNTVYDEHELEWQPVPNGTPTTTPTPTPSPTPYVYTNYRISGSVNDGNGVPVAGVDITLVGDVNTQPVILQTDAAGNFVYNYPPDFGFTVTPSKNGYVFSPNSGRAVSSGSLSGNFGFAFTAILFNGNPPSGIVFPGNAGGSEIVGRAEVTITRSGDVSNPVTVKYQTADGTASQKSDYTFVSGTLRFAANENSKTIVVPVTDDVYVEGNENFKVQFESGFQGVFINTNMTILDNDSSPPTTNPMDIPQFFVRQHYYDFLGRLPDQAGLDYWTGQIQSCDSISDPQGRAACVHDRMISVSAAFFIELEFQDTGYFVYRLYKAALGRMPSYQEFIADRNNVIGGSALEASKQSLAYEFAQRSEFRQKYSSGFNVDYVNLLFDTAGLTPYTAERQQELDAMNAGRTHAQVLRDLIEIDAFKQREYNPSFVLMQYYGYLRRDIDQRGFNFWLDVLNRLPPPNNYHSMVCGFITSDEYQDRFSPVRTHGNSECSP